MYHHQDVQVHKLIDQVQKVLVSDPKRIQSVELVAMESLIFVDELGKSRGNNLILVDGGGKVCC